MLNLSELLRPEFGRSTLVNEAMRAGGLFMKADKNSTKTGHAQELTTPVHLKCPVMGHIDSNALARIAVGIGGERRTPRAKGNNERIGRNRIGRENKSRCLNEKQ